MKYLLSFFLFFSTFSTVQSYGAEKHQTYQITLYYSPSCAYSQKVLSYLKKTGLTIPMKNVKGDSAAQDELQEIGGHRIVPCLVVDGEAIYNANDIIDWLSAHQEDLS
jgi:glutaredoxin